MGNQDGWLKRFGDCSISLKAYWNRPQGNLTMRDTVLQVLRNLTVIRGEDNAGDAFTSQTSQLFESFLEQWSLVEKKFLKLTANKSLVSEVNGLLEDVESTYRIHVEEYLQLLKDYNQLQDADKKALAKKAVESFHRNLKNLVAVFNVRADLAIEDLKQEQIEYPAQKALEKLSKLTAQDVYDAWLEPRRFLLTDDLLDVLEED